MDYEKSSTAYKGGLLTNEVIEVPTNSREEEKENHSCIEGLNETGMLSSYLICSVVGLLLQLFSFDGSRRDFFFWFGLGNLAMFFGICFIAKLSYQLSNLNTRKRKEFAAVYWLAVIVIIFCKMQFQHAELLVVLVFFAEILGYFQYARTYVELFDSFAKRLFGGFGSFEQ